MFTCGASVALRQPGDQPVRRAPRSRTHRSRVGRRGTQQRSARGRRGLGVPRRARTRAGRRTPCRELEPGVDHQAAPSQTGPGVAVGATGRRHRRFDDRRPDAAHREVRTAPAAVDRRDRHGRAGGRRIGLLPEAPRRRPVPSGRGDQVGRAFPLGVDRRTHPRGRPRHPGSPCVAKSLARTRPRRDAARTEVHLERQEDHRHRAAHVLRTRRRARRRRRAKGQHRLRRRLRPRRTPDRHRGSPSPALGSRERQASGAVRHEIVEPQRGVPTGWATHRHRRNTTPDLGRRRQRDRRPARWATPA